VRPAETVSAGMGVGEEVGSGEDQVVERKGVVRWLARAWEQLLQVDGVGVEGDLGWRCCGHARAARERRVRCA
jgi:hypothetical protein